MLLLHHNPDGASGRTRADVWRFTKPLLFNAEMTLVENWSARQDLHLRSLRPKRSMLLLHYALFAPARFGRAPGALFSLEANRSVPGRRPAVRFVG